MTFGNLKSNAIDASDLHVMEPRLHRLYGIPLDRRAPRP